MVSTDGQRGGAIQLRPDGRVGRSLCSLPLGVHSKDYRPAGDPTRAPRFRPLLTSFTSAAETQAFRANPRHTRPNTSFTPRPKSPEKGSWSARKSGGTESITLSVPPRLCVKRPLAEPALRFLLLPRLRGQDQQRRHRVRHALWRGDDLAHVLPAWEERKS